MVTEQKIFIKVKVSENFEANSDYLQNLEFARLRVDEMVAVVVVRGGGGAWYKMWVRNSLV